MTKALTKAPATGYTPEQIRLIKDTVAVGATDNELGLFFQVCKNHKLDPFTRQIHFVKRAGKGTIQISIDGFRTMAERTGCYAGNDDPVFDDEAKPARATVTVWKMVNGVRCPFTATARWAQYCPGAGQDFMWKKMPHLMLGKCAEALALRKAFPEELSGLYTDDEMQQAGKQETEQAKLEVVETVAEERATAEQMTEIDQLCKETGSDVRKLYAWAQKEGLLQKGQAIPTAQQAAALIVVLKRKLDDQLAKAAAKEDKKERVDPSDNTAIEQEPPAVSFSQHSQTPTEAEVIEAERKAMHEPEPAASNTTKQ